MARNRASMREGPLADLFRATEAAKRGAKEEHTGQQQLPTEPVAEESEPEPTPLRVAAPAVVPEPAPEADSRAGGRAHPAALARSDPRSAGATRTSARRQLVPRGDPRRRRRRRRPQRRRPHDRRRHHAGRLRGGQHRHPAAADVRRVHEDPHRQRAHRRAWLRRRSGDRPRALRRKATTRSSARCAARTWCS